ncbi:MAG: electron transport complex subunit RsxC [Spirochaetes bacterium]|nr:electron transport complex subunit RsxC [Spirochaetota bacterium]
MFFTKNFGMGGIHAEDFKFLTNHKKIENADVPNIAYIPVNQHLGTPAEIIVKEGQEVEEGQLIAKANGFISSNVHSSIPGTVIKIEERFTSIGKRSKVVVIQLKGEFKKSGKILQLVDWRSKSKDFLLDKIKEYGIVGLGGATFPAHVKLSIPKDKKVDTFIVNGAECEPFLTADHRLMIDKSEDLLEGISIISTILENPKVYIGIEENKKDAIKRLKILSSNKYNIKIVPLRVRYPQGDEKQLIKAITGRIVPAGKIPLEINTVVHNVSTVIAIKEAIVNDKPLIERVVTVTGSGIKEPKNLKVKVGTPVKEVINECGGLKPGVKKVIIGGPMMGFAQMDLEVPVTKACSGILAFTDEELSFYKTDSICINCGRCVISCAFGLMPTYINKLLKYKKFKEVIDAGLLNCKECGCCSWVCPAQIPLVQNFKLGKDITKKLKLY